MSPAGHCKEFAVHKVTWRGALQISTAAAVLDNENADTDPSIC